MFTIILIVPIYDYIRFLARNGCRMQRYAKILNGKSLEYKIFFGLCLKIHFD